MKGPQKLAQGAFLAVEGLFNRLFGERLNPFYYLGAIAYFQLWIVVASGLYLYAFFETSVTAAYQSVEQLTHAQPWAGGILRSMHRYASDGMVLAMYLHLARHFVFGHHRGFRWFSWVSGVALLGLVYASGINGYMLPWDGLAQFVVTATTEWLDALPIFNGTLARNFLDAASVNDRLFSLLSFMHIGLPLAVLALLWIHTQRVPKANTQPPRPIAIGIVAMLAGLSLVKPALSQGAADLGFVAQSIGLDWFYLPVYPLIYRWGLTATWTLVAVGGAIFFLMPWIPPRFKRAAAGDGLDLPVVTGIARAEYVQRRAAVEPRLRGALALAQAWRGGGREALGRLSEIHLDPGDGTTIYVGDDGVQVRLGTGDLEAKLARLEQVLSTLGAEGRKAEVIHLDNRLHPSWVTVRLAAVASQSVKVASPRGL
jgi:quinol-cytochrome oxidoreductase complex cytochrome b subunit